MPTLRRATRVRAPLADVWDFHRDPEGLRAVTPAALGLRIETIDGAETGPDGRPRLAAGSSVRCSVRPLGIGPRTAWLTVIERLDHEPTAASFLDRMVAGPFEEWRHRHTVVADGDETILVDQVTYELPAGLPPRLAGAVERLFLAPAFRYRHRRTRALLEDGEPVRAVEPTG